MQTIWQDLQYGIRGMRKQPSFTALAVLALALGIGAATTIFSVIHNVLLDPFPYPNADRVVTFYIHDVKQSGIGGRSFFRTAEFLEYQNQNHVFEEVIGGGNEDILLTTSEGTITQPDYAGAHLQLHLPDRWKLHLALHSQPADTGDRDPRGGSGGDAGAKLL